ncbi:MAG: hypothetical protein A2Z95_06195 [Gallionellales bacterium GWA2_60_18]|nr:MAG: hypothetical protein A2Z95_06195 [Gallionellales bacterium GWA2_60_18]
MEAAIKSYTAGAEINPCRFVKAGSADLAVIQAVSGAAAILGVTEQVVGTGTSNVAAIGAMVDVVRIGQAYLELGDTVTRGQYLTADSVGRGVPATIAAGTAVYCGGIAEISGVVGDIIPVQLVQAVVATDTGIITANVTVSTAELLALNATPKLLVAAPGSGKALIVEDVQMMLDYNSTAYDGIAAGEDLEIRYTDGSGQLVATIETTGFLDATADAYRHVRPATAAAITPVANAALVLDLASGEIATGNSPLKVRVRYREITLAL